MWPDDLLPGSPPALRLKAPLLEMTYTQNKARWSYLTLAGRLPRQATPRGGRTELFSAGFNPPAAAGLVTQALVAAMT